MPAGIETNQKVEDIPPASSNICPQCSSSLVWKDGFRSHEGVRIQRYLCRICGARFSESTSNLKGESEFGDSSRGEGLNNLSEESGTRRVGASNNGVINTVATETIGKIVAGDVNETKSLLVQYSWYLKNRGNREATIESRVRLLKILDKRGANLSNPESVKKAISEQKWVDKRKCNGVDSYTLFLRMQNKTWDPPRYKVTRNLPFIPREAELDSLIAGSTPILATFLQIMKETAARRGEAHSLHWNDIDFETGTIRLSPEKGSNPRIVRVSKNLVSMLQRIKVRRMTADTKRVFQAKIGNTMESFYRVRKRIALKLGNPRINQIHAHTFRHWKATMLYHQTKDPLRVQRFLGHTSFQHTQLYIQLEESLFQDMQDDYMCKTATTAEEARALIEVGFEYVNEIQGIHLYRKRK